MTYSPRLAILVCGGLIGWASGVYAGRGEVIDAFVVLVVFLLASPIWLAYHNTEKDV